MQLAAPYNAVPVFVFIGITLHCRQGVVGGGRRKERAIVKGQSIARKGQDEGRGKGSAAQGKGKAAQRTGERNGNGKGKRKCERQRDGDTTLTD